MKKDKRRNDEPGDVRPGEFNNEFNEQNQDFDQPQNFEEQGERSYEESFDQEQQEGRSRNNRRRSRMQEQQGPEEEEESYEGEEGEEEDEDGEFAEERNGKGFKQIEKVAKKVMAYMKEHSEEIDKKTVAKYAAVGVLMLYGMRRNSVLGSMMVSIAAGIITKYILENAMDGQEEKSAQAA